MKKTIQRYTCATAFWALLLMGCSKHAHHPATGGETYSQQAVGRSANDLLTAGRFTSLVLEIDYMGDHPPDPGAVDQLRSFLLGILHKPAGITVTSIRIPASGGAPLDETAIGKLEKQYRTRYPEDSTLAVYLLYADADCATPGVLGVAYRNTSLCLFGKTISDHSGGIGQASKTKLTATVLEHEMGHLMGLVNTGTPMAADHEDPDHPHHCDDQNCLMYYAAETTDILGALIAGGAPSLDAHCLADLKAAGSR